MWFSEGCYHGCENCSLTMPTAGNYYGAPNCAKPLEPTLPDEYATWNIPDKKTGKRPSKFGDWTKYHPWRAPGRAPVADPWWVLLRSVLHADSVSVASCTFSQLDTEYCCWVQWCSRWVPEGAGRRWADTRGGDTPRAKGFDPAPIGGSSHRMESRWGRRSRLHARELATPLSAAARPKIHPQVGCSARRRWRIHRERTTAAGAQYHGLPPLAHSTQLHGFC